MSRVLERLLLATMLFSFVCIWVFAFKGQFLFSFGAALVCIVVAELLTECAHHINFH